MDRFVLFALGGLARAFGTLLSAYGDWLLQRLTDGADDVLDLIGDGWQFARALVTSLAERLLGRGGRDVRVRDDGWEPDFYRR